MVEMVEETEYTIIFFLNVVVKIVVDRRAEAWKAVIGMVDHSAGNSQDSPYPISDDMGAH